MARKVRMSFLSVIASIVFLASIYHNLFRDEISVYYLRQPPVSDCSLININYAIREDVNHQSSRRVLLGPRLHLLRLNSITGLGGSQANRPEREYEVPELIRWNLVVYESLSTEKDVILFVKGLNNRQGKNREPREFRCVFGDDLINGVKTTVTTSLQEVFRCQRPELTSVSSSWGDEQRERIKISLEIPEEKRVVPSVAYYTSARKTPIQKEKSLVCACTMVYNVAKFLKEWVVYHSKIGVEKFILYDNDSDDDLEKVVEELVHEGHDVKTLFWIWPKTQEAGFSHCAIYAKDSCKWMIYIDVDEFVYSPSWINSSQPSNSMLKYLLPKDPQ
ncbi:hypothetical protein F0562_026909 [Nyssa sinensis]|uniref:Glycosyltransferase family 92 protein n=1 Tax=Nyssa sinensis TaxID=561372 RepID=A0A5J5B4B8_9ASTE|nr:hypothetical protein F0562_026909 [Nyssa sinensis]